METSIIQPKNTDSSMFSLNQGSVTEFSSNAKKTIVSLPTKKVKVPHGQHKRIIDLCTHDLCLDGKLKEAVNALESRVKSGFKVKPNTYMSLLESCIDSYSIVHGRKIHELIDFSGTCNLFVETKLISMYAKCGSLEDAQQVFDEMRERNLFTWSAMIGGYVREQRWKEVLNLFFEMMAEGLIPDGLMLPKILQACGNSGDLKTGKLIHSFAIRNGMCSSLRVNNSLLSMYVKCWKLQAARNFFENMDKKDPISWNSMIYGYCQRGELNDASKLFERMQTMGMIPGLVTWNTLIAGYNQYGNYELAMEMMWKMESLGITPDVFTWTTMISGCTQNTKNNQALDLFREMVVVGVEPNGVTLASAISACTSLKAFNKGSEIHSIAVKMGETNDVLVINSLIDLYGKYRKLEAAKIAFDSLSEKDVFTWNSMIGAYCQAGYCGKAYELFMKMPDAGIQRNVITWNVIISGYLQNGDEDGAMELFHNMESTGIKRNTASWNSVIAGSLQSGHKDNALRIFRQMQSVPMRSNYVTILSVIPACANLVSSSKLKEIHGHIIRCGLDSEVSVVNSLIDAYSKSGRIACARSVFDNTSTKDIISWNSIISGHLLHGYPQNAMDLFNQMKQAEIKPNTTTITSLITSYGLAGMVDEGKELFMRLSDAYQLSPSMEHHAAIVDLLGRSGRLGEAAEFVEKMTMEPGLSVWTALLTASRNHGNIRLASHALENIVKLAPGKSGYHRLLSQLHSLCGISKDNLGVRKSNYPNALTDPVGCSWIQIHDRVCAFFTGQTSMPQANLLYARLDKMTKNLKLIGSKASHFHFHLEDEEVEEIVGVHSEKLAITFALINSSSSQTINIIKNRRVCKLCHETTKAISMAYGREIFLKDPGCLHHFRNGDCSCKDYW